MRAILTYLIGPQKGERKRFDDAAISIGRAPDNLLCLGDGARRVSSHHAEITRRGDHYLLRDLGSTNGTMINGRRVVISELEHDDLIEFGAGGPLLRFGYEREAEQDQLVTVAVERQSPEGAESDGHSVAKTSTFGLKNNTVLAVALAAAMLIGGIGGILASSRIRGDRGGMNFAEVAERDAPAVVFIRTEFEMLDQNGQVSFTETRTGSGFVASSDGLIITNRHVVRDDNSATGFTGRVSKIEVLFPHQTASNSLAAQVYKLGPDATIDVAILKIDSRGVRPVSRFETETSKTNQGDEVVVIGYPLGLELLQKTNDITVDPSLSAGIVSRVGHDYIQLSLRAYHGNSGGPVFNRKGQVIGILTGNIGGNSDMTLCTPIGAALEMVKNEIRPTNERD